MPRHRFTKSEQISGGAAAGRITFETKTGIHGISESERVENSRRGGVTQGNIQGKLNVESGQLDRIRNLPQTKAAQSRVGKRTGKILGGTYGKLQDMARIKTPESLKLGQKRGGKLSRCSRWHKNRGLWSLGCDICISELEMIWGFEARDPESEE